MSSGKVKAIIFINGWLVGEAEVDPKMGKIEAGDLVSVCIQDERDDYAHRFAVNGRAQDTTPYVMVGGKIVEEE